MSDVAIKVEGLTKIYRLYDDPVDRLKESLHPYRKKYHRDFYALSDVNFEIKKGETVGIIGKNGAGKSTLLKILTGVLNPTQGQVNVKGRVLALLELGTGFNSELTGIENVYFNGALLGASRDEMECKLDAILEFADIGDFVHQPVKTYSSGMIVRLAFAVIANMEPEVLIVDEALSVGDAFFVQKCMRFLRKFIEHGTLLFVSHDTGAVLNLCDRAIWLHEGVVNKDGSPKDVTEAYLANLYEAHQGESVNAAPKSRIETDLTAEPRDMRLDYVNGTSLRNDIELFEFKDDGITFGKGGATIETIAILDAARVPLSWVVGGEEVLLVIRCYIIDDLQNPIIGFMVKDRLGQCVFADNTFLTFVDKPVTVAADQLLEAYFNFRMPVMPVGDYSISVAIAEGTQEEHIQHQWINDSLIFKVHSSSVCLGLIGVPMKEIELVIKK
jgi:lipopolysaccharide transport system ATP-binding protein